MNKQVQFTKEQIHNTLLTLENLGLTRDTQEPQYEVRSNHEFLAWSNHVSGRENCGSNFTKINQYLHIYENGAYHCILRDGSLIRASFEFNRNILLNESLLYWPAPVFINEDEINELGIREALLQNMQKIDEIHKLLIMRSPIRYDYDSTNDSENHPMTHIHIQSAECRLRAKAPICFNTFIKMIFRSAYPEDYPDMIASLSKIHYSGFKETKDAVVNI